MGKLKRSGSGIFVSGVPDEWSTERKIAFLDSVEANIGPVDADFSSIMSAMQSGQTPTGAARAPMREEAIQQETGEGNLSIADSFKRTLGSATELMGGVVRGAGPVATGAAVGTAIGGPIGGAVGAAAVPVTDVVMSSINGLFGTDYPTATEALGALFTKIGIPEPETAVAKVLEAGTRGAAEAATGGLVGQAVKGAQGLQQATSLPGKIATGIKDTFGTNVAEQVGGAVGSEMAAQSAQEAGLGGGAQLGAAIAGDIVGSGITHVPATLSRAARNTPLTTAQRETIEAAERISAPLGASDVIDETTQSRTVRSLKQMGREIPGGSMKGELDKAAFKASKIGELTQEYGAAPNLYTATDIAEDFFNTRGKALSKWSGYRQGAIDNVTTATGNAPVDTTSAVTYLNDRIKELDALGSDFDPITDRLRNWVEDIEGKDLNQLDQIRRMWGQSFDSSTFSSSIRSEGQKEARAAYKKINEAMGDFIKANGTVEDYNKFKQANAQLSNMAKDFQDTSLREALEKGNPNRRGLEDFVAAGGDPEELWGQVGTGTPEAVEQMLLNNNPSTVAKLYERLSPDGQARAQTAVISSFLKKSTGIEGTSANQLAMEIGNYGESLGIIFDSAQRSRLDGLAKYIKATAGTDKLIGSGANVTPRGLALLAAVPGATYGVSRLLGSGGVIGLAAATTAVMGAGGLARAYESPVARNLMVRLANTPANSGTGKELIKRITEIARTSQNQAGGR